MPQNQTFSNVHVDKLRIVTFGPEVTFASSLPSTDRAITHTVLNGKLITDLPLERDVKNDKANFRWASTEEQSYVDLAVDTLFQGPVDPLSFLHRHFPDAGEIPEVEEIKKLCDVATKSNDEYELGQNLTEALQLFCPGMHLTYTREDSNYSESPDLTLFNNQKYGHRSRQESHFVIGFDPEQAPFNDEANEFPFARETFRATVLQGEMVMHAACHLAYQPRTHLFTVFIRREWARFIRWDQAGALVTHAFRYDTEDGAKLLAKFLWMFSHSEDKLRGYDESVTIPGPEDEEVVRRARQELDLPPKDILWKFSLHDDTRPGSVLTYFGGNPFFKGRCHLGRSSRITRVWDPSTQRLAILKDIWREEIDDPAVQKEGDIYRKLHNVGVRNIPPLYQAGDVPLECHRTRMDEVMSLKGRRSPYPERRHYRLVIGHVGHRGQLLHFRDTRELVRAVRDALQAHTDAFRKAGILHCDISGGNILISDEGRGFLIDWENSRPVSEDGVVGDLKEHVGTWQFTSARILTLAEYSSGTSCPFTHTVSDDLESFYHLVSWCTLKRSKHTLSLRTLRSYLEQYYEFYNRPFSGYKKQDFLTSNIMTTSVGLPETALRTLLHDLANILGTRYERRFGVGSDDRDEEEGIKAKLEECKAKLQQALNNTLDIEVESGESSEVIDKSMQIKRSLLECQIRDLEAKLELRSRLSSESMLRCFEEAVDSADWPEADIQCVEHEGEVHVEPPKKRKNNSEKERDDTSGDTKSKKSRIDGEAGEEKNENQGEVAKDGDKNE